MNGHLLFLCRVFAGSVFLWMGIAKLGMPQDFLKAIHTYGILPNTPAWGINLAAITIPWIEIVGGLALISGIFRKPAGLLLSIFLAAFTAAILFRTQLIVQAEDLTFWEVSFDCGCGSGVVVIWQKTLQNAALLFTTAICATTWKNSVSTPPTAPR